MSDILPQEIEFFKKIKDECEIIFDIGCREDIDYIEISEGKTFHLFEPNPAFYKNCKEKLDKIFNNTIYLNNFGISDKTGVYDYWDDYQSFFNRHYKIDRLTTRSPFKLLLKKFSEYLKENKIEKIDFLKIDTEGGEPDILLDFPDFIKNNVKYIQFEYASTWVDRGDDKNLNSIISVFEDYFDFYFLFNKAHPISGNLFYSFLVKIVTQVDITAIENYSQDTFGFEIIMVNKKGTINYDR